MPRFRLPRLKASILYGWWQAHQTQFNLYDDYDVDQRYRYYSIYGTL